MGAWGAKKVCAWAGGMRWGAFPSLFSGEGALKMLPLEVLLIIVHTF